MKQEIKGEWLILTKPGSTATIVVSKCWESNIILEYMWSAVLVSTSYWFMAEDKLDSFWVLFWSVTQNWCHWTTITKWTVANCTK